MFFLPKRSILHTQATHLDLGARNVNDDDDDHHDDDDDDDDDDDEHRV